MSDHDDKRSGRLAYLGALAGGVAHEIRNPLSTINLNLQLLAEDWAEVEGDRGRRARRKLEILQKEARRLEEILENFLKVARGQELNLNECQLNDIVEDVLDLFTPDATAAGIVVHHGLTPDLPKVGVDLSLFKQAVVNLLKNCKEAMPEGGELIIRTLGDDESVQVDIADTGVGIPPEKLERIFDPYYTTKKSGSGLGLATTKRIIEDHGGTISCHSEVGKGTNFAIRLPLGSRE